MNGRILISIGVIAAATVTTGCARLNNLNWSLETVDIDEISETEHALKISGNGFSTQGDLQARADVEAAKLCGEGRYRYRDEAGETYEDWSSYSSTGVIVEKPVLTVVVVCDASEAEGQAEPTGEPDQT